MTPRLPPVSYYPTMPGEVPVPPAYNHIPTVGVGGGGYPPNGYTRPQAVPVAVQPLQPANTTIVVRDRDNGAAEFATGMVMGAALTNWGHGYGWGGGWGWGGSHYGMSSGYYHNDTDVHINNHYDVHNTVINNEVSHNEISYVNEDYGDTGFDDGDYGMDCGGDFGF